MDNIRVYTKKQKIILILLVSASLAGAYTGLLMNARTMPPDAVVPVSRVATIPNPFNTIKIEAKGAYVLDANTGQVLYHKNAQTPYPLASITKVMTALVAAEKQTPSRTIAINEQALQTEGDHGLGIQERWKLQDLIDFMLIESSNDGAAAVAEAVSTSSNFYNEMNLLAQQIGMTNSVFKNETGLDIDSVTPGAYGSSEDIAKMFSYAIKKHPNLLEATQYDTLAFSSLDGVRHPAVNTNTEIGHIPNMIASKTGYTLLAGGTLAVAFDAGINRPVIIVVLGSSQEGRFTDVIELASTSLAYFSVADKGLITNK